MFVYMRISVDLLLKSAGDAPILKKKKWSVDPDKKVGWIIDFLRRYLKCQPSESLVSWVKILVIPDKIKLQNIESVDYLITSIL